jgi:hypothetical protein
MGTTGIVIVSLIIGAIAGFFVACYLTNDIFRERDAEIATLRKQLTEANNECSRLSIANNAARNRMDSMHRELDAKYREANARQL